MKDETKINTKFLVLVIFTSFLILVTGSIINAIVENIKVYSG